jgi:hypothetical protein
MALQAIRVELEPHAATLSWVGGAQGSLGFPRVIPELFGVDLSRRLERMVDRETDRFARSLESRARSSPSTSDT